ncbi:MAG: TonB family protein [Sphingomonas sp.]
MDILHRALFALAALPLIGAAQTAPVITVPPAPAVGAPSLVSYARMSTSCGGVAVVPVLDVQPFDEASWRSPAAPLGPVTLRFRIDAEGRPLGIVADAPAQPFSGSDIAPALAVSRYPAGAPRQDCVAKFRATITPITGAPPARLYRFFGIPHRSSALDWQIFNAVKPAGTSCYDPVPAPRMIAFPDFDKIPQPAGTTSYTVLGYDVDASGRPVRLQVIASDGNAALDAATQSAVSRSRFEPKARTGCLMRFNRRQHTPVVAPPAPEAASLAPPDARCQNPLEWSFEPKLVFPEAYNRRSIEGWAVIGFDVAPWGETGNIHVLASEPSADFGEAAKRIIEQSRKPSMPNGLTGCAERVRFLLPRTGQSSGPEPESQ